MKTPRSYYKYVHLMHLYIFVASKNKNIVYSA